MTDTPAFGRRGLSPSPAFGRPAPSGWSDMPVRKGNGGGGAPSHSPEVFYKAEERPKALDFPTTTANLFLPWLTVLIIAAMAGVFWVEAGGLSGGALDFDPSSTRLRALGGFSGLTVFRQHEFWRLFTAPLLHANMGHIVGNSIVFLMCGVMLEGRIGRAWYGAIFAVAGVAGCIASLLMHAQFKVGIGASGAIMGLLTAIFVSSFHTEAISYAGRMRWIAGFIGATNLIPYAGSSTDYSAHFGGAVAGAAMGFVLMAVWGENQTKPGQRALATGIGLFGIAAAAISFALVALNFSHWNIEDPRLAPEKLLRGKPEEIAKRSPVLVLQYPHDPRIRFFHAMALYQEKDIAGMETDLRAALAEPQLVAEESPPQFEQTLTLLLAASVDAQGRQAEAKTIIAPICDFKFDNPGMRDMLRAARHEGLCQAQAASAGTR